jgi:hypothetical protein
MTQPTQVDVVVVGGATIGAQAALPRRDAVLALLAQTSTRPQHQTVQERGRE